MKRALCKPLPHRSVVSKRALPIGLCLAVSLLLGSCGKTEPARGGLMLILSTDGPLPLNRIDIEIHEQDRTPLSRSYRVPEEAQLPTTIAIVSNGDPQAQVQIAVTGWQVTPGHADIPLDRREAIVTQVPTDRVATLKVALSARCSDKLTIDGDGRLKSTCVEGQACSNEGICTPVTVAADDLSSYRPGDENAAAGSGAGGASGSGGTLAGIAGAAAGAGGGFNAVGGNIGSGGAMGSGGTAGASSAGTAGMALGMGGGSAGSAGAGGMNGGGAGGPSGGRAGAGGTGASGGRAGAGGGNAGRAGANMGGAAGGTTVTLAAIAGLKNQYQESMLDSFIMMPCYMASAFDCLTTPGGICPNQNPALPMEQQGRVAQESFTMGGQAGKSYKLTLHVTGIADGKYYSGGARAASDPMDADDPNGIDTFYTGGAPVNFENYAIYKLTVRDPAGAELQHYYLNSMPQVAASPYEVHRTYPINFTHDIVVPGAGFVEYLTADRNCRVVDNCGSGPHDVSCVVTAGRNLPSDPTVQIPTTYMGTLVSSLNVRNGAVQPFHSQIFHIAVTAVTEM